MWGENNWRRDESRKEEVVGKDVKVISQKF